MRVSTLLAMLLLSTMTLSGCFGSDDAPAHDDECEDAEDHDACHDDGTGNGDGDHMDGNETVGNATPNMPPVAFIQMTGPDGQALNGSNAVMTGETITFTFNGTADEDGTLDLAALTIIQDGDVTTTNVDLAGSFEINFTVDGPLVATLRVLDDQGAAGLAVATTYVNLKQMLSESIWGGDPGAVDASDCEGPGQGAGAGSVAEQNAMVAMTFNTRNNTRWIEATTTSSNVDIAICRPDRTAMTEEGTTVMSEEEDIAPGVNYYVFAVSRSARGTPPAGEAIDVEVIVHWEPKPAA
jgi:hypothetical protein